MRKEWVLPPNEEVCVAGRWDGHSLVPDRFRPRGLPVYAGSAEYVSSQLGGASKLWFALGLVPFVVAGWQLFGHLV